MEINGMEIGMQGIDPASQIARERGKDEKEIRQDISILVSQMRAIDEDEKKIQYIENRGLSVALSHIGDMPEYWLFKDMFGAGWDEWHVTQA